MKYGALLNKPITLGYACKPIVA